MTVEKIVLKLTGFFYYMLLQPICFHNDKYINSIGVCY